MVNTEMWLWQSYQAYFDGLISLDKQEHHQTKVLRSKDASPITYIERECEDKGSLKTNGQLITATIGKVDVLNDHYKSVTKGTDDSILDEGQSPSL